MIRPDHPENRPLKGKWRQKLHDIIFEAETPAGKAFDVWLLVFILGSVAAVIMESVAELDRQYHVVFATLEWIFTIAFSIEYGLRLYSVKRPLKYATSFYGVIDLLSVLPTYISLLIPGSQYLLTLRALRLLRIFRIFKLARYVSESRTIAQAMRASLPKITVFILTVLIIVLFLGSAMYVIEGNHPESGFTSIPRSMYWAIVTVTTVGFGDITPVTGLGQFVSAVLMLIGYSIIAVPTGIVSAELNRSRKETVSTEACPSCSREGHDPDAKYCKFCGEHL